MSTTVLLLDREECYKLLREARFGETVTCVECGSNNLIKRGTTSKDAQRYQCKDCGNYFNDLSDTPFESRRLAIEELAYIIQNVEQQTEQELSDTLGVAEDAVITFLEEVEEEGNPKYIEALSGPDFRLLMAGDILSPFVGEENVDPQSDAFSHWLMNLTYEE